MRISIDPEELAALSVLVRNTSYDVAGIATEARHRVDQLAALVSPADALRITALVDDAMRVLHRVASQLDDDAQAVALFGQKGASADALGDLAGSEHDLLSRMHQPTLGDTE
jgi:hypothetical protein